MSGHWSWLDEGGVTSTQWANGNGWNMKYDFCFRDEDCFGTTSHSLFSGQAAIFGMDWG